jgi:hypothetical protein
MLKWPSFPKTEKPTAEPIITPEADQELFRVMLIYFVITFVLLMVVSIGMAPINIPGNPFFPYHRFLDYASTLMIMIPFFLGTNKVSAIKLRWGRLLVNERRWKEAVAALDSFVRFGQQSFDTTGEAHYLLATAFARTGEPVKAERARAFVLKHRASGPWAERLLADDAARSRGISSVERVRTGERVKTTEMGEPRVRIAKGKRRRF